MIEINIREARQNLKSILDRVVAGEEVRILRRGKEIARVVPPPAQGRKAPAMKAFRQSIQIKGKPMSQEVVAARREERN
jgi:prevent-host-death family protein